MPTSSSGDGVVQVDCILLMTLLVVIIGYSFVHRASVTCFNSLVFPPSVLGKVKAM